MKRSDDYLYSLQKLRNTPHLTGCSLSNNKGEEYETIFNLDWKKLTELASQYPDPDYFQLLDELREHYSIRSRERQSTTGSASGASYQNLRAAVVRLVSPNSR